MAADEGCYGSVEGSFETRRATPPPRPRSPGPLVVHGALMLVFLFFGGGSFVSKFGIHGASPLMFELVREAVVGPFFCLAAKAMNGRIIPDSCDLPRVLGVALCFALAQACFFLGLKHENPTVGSTWQAALPICTTLIAVATGQETASYRKASGIALASGGAMWMTIGTLVAARSSVASTEGGSWLDRIDGHALFFGQCVCNSLYIVKSKPIVSKYGGISLSAWMFLTGTAILLAFVLFVKANQGLSVFVCADDRWDIVQSCTAALMQIPSSMIWPLVYEVICCSFIAWFLLTWSLQHAQASMVSVYTVVQPCTTCILSVMAICLKGKEWAQRYHIDVPGLHSLLGGLLIGVGLWVMLAEDMVPKSAKGREGKSLMSGEPTAKGP